MHRIRFHGRGGQGIKTASRILGTAFFREGFEVQDAPRYGAERRGAPMSAYVRAGKGVILERGVIHRPDLVVVADDTLIAMPAAGVLSGAGPVTVLLLHTPESSAVWQERLNFPGQVLTLPDLTDQGQPLPPKLAGAAGAGAAARLAGVITRASLEQAVQDELAPVGEAAVSSSLEAALAAYDFMADHAGCLTEGPEIPGDPAVRPHWLDLPFEDAGASAPDIFAQATSVRLLTGLWRTMRPIIDYQRCHRCAWICSTLCPDGVISQNQEGFPVIDYEHCKGCLICLASCPARAIRAVPEAEAAGKHLAEGARGH